MSQMDQLSACPRCDEPLEAGDLFCGDCGYDLSTAPAAGPGSDQGDHPTVVMGTAVPAPPAPDGAPLDVDWPEAAPGSTGSQARTLRPGDVPGTDSTGDPLSGNTGHHPVPGAQAAAGPHAAPGARPVGETAAGNGDFELAAPDPRMAAAPSPAAAPASAPAPATPPAGTRLCVACRAGHVAPDGYCENCGHAQPRERDHMERELDAVAAVSDKGLRHHRNEDAFAISTTALPDGSPAVVAIVCDGVSSATRPDEASAAAAAAANESLLAALPRGTHPQTALHEAIVAAADAVNALADAPAGAQEHDPHRHHHQNAPACTIVGSVVAGGLLVVGWIGDSRAYWVPDDRSGPPARLTEDDSWAAQMVAAGLMNEAEAYADERAHAITGWLGADAYEIDPHTASFKPDRPGVVVVCTDGLWNYAEAAEEMAAAIPADAALRPLHSARVLVGHALDGGGHDNVTVAVVPFALPPRGAGSAYGEA
ncbi:PP2C family serine/threonine-protein phosphatase [Streptomyces sp. NPDC050504]|uniref:PP2C family serine/threonine-protein phosphatase n=1 Tax=Streptomyces sp. NPDC050504 TaxID=3365618 RepID=UPI00379415BA